MAGGVRFLAALLGLGAATAGVSGAEAGRRPNFLVIVADDMGFSDPGCYGGEIATPNLDALAAGGLRFTQFYNTARCWSTRSCLVSGYYPQQIRMDPPAGRLPVWARLLPHRLKPAGYRCYHSGKWHVNGAPLPCADGGFDRSYRFEDWDRYFTPAKHFEDDRQLPEVKPEAGYYATTAFADHMIRCLKEHAEKHAAEPFFGYLAFIAPHFPLHAPEADIARYRGRYEEGWDALRVQRAERVRGLGIADCALAAREPGFTPRYFKPGVLDQLGPGEIEHPVAWDELSDVQKTFQARKMAIHAAMVDRMDREIGRVLEQLRAMGAFEDTVVLFLSDNGADATILVRGNGHDPGAAPGSAGSFLCLGPGWASASNAPFRRYKVWVHEAGISTPLIVHWPRGIAARGELRRAVGHVIDIAPTVLALAGIAQDSSMPGRGAPPLPGLSLVPVFPADRPIARDFLFFHHEGNRALRQGDWKLVSAREDGGAWQLYDMAADRCEAHDIAARHPEKVVEMSRRWVQCEEEFRRQAGPAVPIKQGPR